MSESGENERAPRRKISVPAIVSLLLSLPVVPCFFWWFFPVQWDDLWIYASWAIGTLSSLGACVCGVVALSQRRTHRLWALGIVGVLMAIAWICAWVIWCILLFTAMNF